MAVAPGGDHRQGGGDGGRREGEGDTEGLREGAAAASRLPPHQELQQQQQQQQSGSPSVAILQAETVLASTADGLVRLFARADGGDGGNRLVSKQTWAACVAEAGRRRLRVAHMLGGERVGRAEAVGRGERYGGAAASGSGGVRVAATETGPEDEEGDDEM